MNILFLTVSRINDLSDKGIYTDLMRKFAKEGHSVFIVTPLERRYKQSTELVRNGVTSLLRIRTLNFQKAGLFEKFLSALLINIQFKRGIGKHFGSVRFDLVLYSTPPITFTRLVGQLKSKYSSVSYLLLKDIFPQNAVDLGYMRKNSLLHRYFLKREKKLYRISDFIGCMSAGNVEYLLRMNPEINPGKVEINPNCHELYEISATSSEKKLIRKNLNIPEDAVLFVFGGNMGISQGIGFFIKFLESQINGTGVFFLIIGSGTESKKIHAWFNARQPSNAIFLPEMAKQDFNKILKACDAGMIFLDRRFTIPNFPSRILSYLENKLAIIAATDSSTDLGQVIVRNGFGLWSEAGDLDSLAKNVSFIAGNPHLCKIMGEKGYNYMKDNFSVDISYNAIVNHFPGCYAFQESFEN